MVLGILVNYMSSNTSTSTTIDDVIYQQTNQPEK